MSAHKFTPGPWAVKKAEDCMGRQLDDAVKWVVTGNEHDTWISTGPTWDQEHAEESEANARLIAASVTYFNGVEEFIAYEAAVVAGDDVAAMQHYARASQLLRDAHAKATGESA